MTLKQRITIAIASLFVGWQSLTFFFMSWGFMPSIYIDNTSWLTVSLISATFIAKGMLVIVTLFASLLFFSVIFEN